MMFCMDMDHGVLIVLLCLWSPVIPEDIRLVGGASRCAGVLELAKQEKWEPVQVKASDLARVAETCRQLNCGSAVSVRGIRLKGDDLFSKSIFDNSHYKLEITCSSSVRLVNGTNLCSGRLEVKSYQLWSPVCEKGFGQLDAELVCKELGCGAPSAFQGGLHGEGAQTDGFQCEGAAVGLTCSDPDEMRLVGGANRCTGIFELKHNGEWRAVISHEDVWDLKTSTKICARLDCGSAVSTQRTRDNSEKHVHYINYTCFQSKYSLRECVLVKDTETDSRLEITCSVTFTRLVNGTDLCSGRLEVKPNQLWSLVCGDGFDQQDAEVVCRELGCGAPSAFQVGLYRGKAPVWMEEFQCDGNESALRDCRRSASVAQNCSADKAVGLTCSDPHNIRLVGETHRCAGELEMKNQGEWRPVVDWISKWNQESAATVCRQLGCGSAVSTHGTETDLDRPVWWINSTCVKLASARTDCVIRTGHPEYFAGHQVICSDLLAQPNISLSPTDGDSKANQRLVQLLMGTNFTITCSTEPQYQGGTFHLVSNRAQNHTLPAVNHSAHFLFSAADHTHQGDYRCVYHIQLFSHNFSSGSPLLYVYVSAPLTELLIRSTVLLLSMLLLITALCISSKASSRRQSTALGKNAEPNDSGLGGFSNDYVNAPESRGDREISQPQHQQEEVKQA